MPQCQSTNVYYRVYVQINTTVKNERDNWFAFVLKLSFSSSGSLHSMPLFNNKKNPFTFGKPRKYIFLNFKKI